MRIGGTHVGLKRPVEFSGRLLTTNDTTIQTELIWKTVEDVLEAKENESIVLTVIVELISVL